MPAGRDAGARAHQQDAGDGDRHVGLHKPDCSRDHAGDHDQQRDDQPATHMARDRLKLAGEARILGLELQLQFPEAAALLVAQHGRRITIVTGGKRLIDPVAAGPATTGWPRHDRLPSPLRLAPRRPARPAATNCPHHGG